MGSDSTQADRGQGVALLADPHRLQSDLHMLGKAVRKRWDVPDDVRRVVIKRLHEIVEKRSVVVLTKAGPFNSEGAADSNATAAARVLAQIEAQVQADDHLAEKYTRIDEGKATEARAATAPQSMDELVKALELSGRPVDTWPLPAQMWVRKRVESRVKE